MQGLRNLGEAYALAKIQEDYLATLKRSSRPTYEPNRYSWSQSQSQQGVTEMKQGLGTLGSLASGLLWLCKD